MIAKGKGSTLAFFVFFIVVFYLQYQRIKSGKPVYIRRIEGLEAIDEAVGRATELGKPVHYTFGIGEMDSNVLASLDVLKSVAAKCAKMDTDIIVSNARPDILPLTEEIVRQAYLMEGKPESYKPDNIRFLSDNQTSYVAAIYGIFAREQPGANIMLGPFSADSLLIAEVGAEMGCLQIGGTGRVVQVSFLVAACDYTLIGEELFAAGAYVSRHPLHIAALMAQEVSKYLVMGLMVVGALLNLAGVKALSDLMRM